MQILLDYLLTVLQIIIETVMEKHAHRSPVQTVFRI